MMIRQDTIERYTFLLVVLTLVTIAIGGIVEIVPLFTIETTVEHVKGMRPYSPLELRGRDIYVREGCYLCHSQQIRALKDEVERYGHYSLAAESMYDHPFQWGSKRIGPDLARVAGKYSNDWHYAHLIDAQALVPESLMPHYAFLAETPLDYSLIADHLRTLRSVGVPYTDEQIADATKDLLAQANPDADTADLVKRYPKAVNVPGRASGPTELDALVAYLQVLGTMVDFADTSTEQLINSWITWTSRRSFSGSSTTRSSPCSPCLSRSWWRPIGPAGVRGSSATVVSRCKTIDKETSVPTKIEKDAVTGRSTTGHDWDGLKELNTPLPKWWLYTFIATVIWAAAWFVLYPSIPGVTGYFHGILGYSQRKTVDADVRALADQRAGTMDRINTMDLVGVEKDPQLLAVAATAGRIAFANNCQPCHGAGGQGRVGYPSLADDVWLWGGTRDQILQTITHGIRSGDPDTRTSQMPRFGADGILKPAEIEQVADYVMTLFGSGTAGADVAAGKQLFADNCAACHGDNGQGNREFGAPPLRGAIHLYGDTRDAVVAQITNPRMGVMPAWNTRLDGATIKSLALYVHGLGGGE